MRVESPDQVGNRNSAGPIFAQDTMLLPGSISQICYVSYDASAAAAQWARLSGAGPFFTVELPGDLRKIYRGRPAQDTFIACIGFLGTTCIEILQPTNEAPSIIREVLGARGEGAVHHVYPRIRPLDHAAYDELSARYRAEGLEEALSFYLPGVGRNAFYDATQTLGCFIEILECGEQAYQTMLGGMLSAHLQWDGRNLIRSMESLNTIPPAFE
jgi:hypothetical protein